MIQDIFRTPPSPAQAGFLLYCDPLLTPQDLFENEDILTKVLPGYKDYSPISSYNANSKVL